MALQASLIPALRDLVGRLIARDFTALEADGRIGRLTVAELAGAIDDYGRTLVEIPESGWALADAYAIEDRPGSWSLDLPLWTAEEGRSDLTLSLSVVLGEEGQVAVAIDDLHVL